jgi:hypothetical protein
MGKVTGAMVTVFLIGGGAMGTLGVLLGPLAEAAAVGLMGTGLLLCSGLMGARVPAAPVRVPEEA